MREAMLSNSSGSVLDPVVAIRRSVRLEPRESATVILVCGIAPTREEMVNPDPEISRTTPSPTVVSSWRGRTG